MIILTEKEKDIFKQRLSDNMQMLRGKLGISQAELAETIGVSRQTINSVENCRQNMSWNLFTSLILFFLYNEDTKELLPVIMIDMQKIEDYLNTKRGDSENAQRNT